MKNLSSIVIPTITLSDKTELLSLIEKDVDSVARLIMRSNGNTPDNFKLLDLMEIVGVEEAAKVLVPIVVKNNDALQEIFENSSEIEWSDLEKIVLEFSSQNSSVPIWEWFFDTKWQSMTSYSELNFENVYKENGGAEFYHIEKKHDMIDFDDFVDSDDFDYDSNERWPIIFQSEQEELMNHISEIAPELATKIQESMKSEKRKNMSNWIRRHSKENDLSSTKIITNQTLNQVNNLLPQTSDYV